MSNMVPRSMYEASQKRARYLEAELIDLLDKYARLSDYVNEAAGPESVLVPISTLRLLKYEQPT